MILRLACDESAGKAEWWEYWGGGVAPQPYEYSIRGRGDGAASALAHSAEVAGTGQSEVSDGDAPHWNESTPTDLGRELSVPDRSTAELAAPVTAPFGRGGDSRPRVTYLPPIFTKSAYSLLLVGFLTQGVTPWRELP